MIKLVTMLACFMISYISYSQENNHCECENVDIATRISLIKKDTEVSIRLHCVLYLRLYLLNDEGEEYEKYKLRCISETSKIYTLSKNVEYVFFDEKNNFLSNNDGAKAFEEIINSTDNYFFKYSLNEKNQINRIKDWTDNLKD